jgi:hypothetical protein
MNSFASFAGFAAHLAEVMVETAIVEREALENAAVIIEKAAKAKIGEYQDQAGEFAAWADLAESTKQDRVAKGFSEDDPGLRTGQMRDSIEHQVHGSEAEIGSNDDDMVWFDQGTVKQPPRSVFGGTAFEQGPVVAAEIGAEMFAVLSGTRKR